MMVFNGASSTEASTILQLEKLLLIPSMVYCVYAGAFYLKKSLGLKVLWRRIPGYLIFSLCVINSLIFSGFLAFYLVQKNIGHSPENFEIIPLWVGLSSSIGILFSFSFLNRNKPYSSYQDRLQARADNFTQKN